MNQLEQTENYEINSIPGANGSAPQGSPEDIFSRHFMKPRGGAGPADEFLKTGDDSLALLIRSNVRKDLSGPLTCMYMDAELANPDIKTYGDFMFALNNYIAAISVAVGGEARKEYGRAVMGWRPPWNKKPTKKSFGEQSQNYET